MEDNKLVLDKPKKKKPLYPELGVPGPVSTTIPEELESGSGSIQGTSTRNEPAPTSTETPPAEVKSLAKELSRGNKDSEKYLAEMRAWAENPDNKRTTPPDTQATLKDALDRAESLHRENATRNEWLEVAQRLGDAVTRYGAAQAGLKSGIDMSKIDTGPNIDYGARTDRSLKEFEGSSRRAGDLADRTRQGWADTEASRKENYGNKEDFLKTALHDAQLRNTEDLRYSRDLDKEGRAEKSATQREDRSLRDKNLKELDTKEKELQLQLQGRQSLVNQMSDEGDLKESDRSKLEAKYSSTAGKAGLDLGDLKSDLEKTDKEGSWWQWGKNQDPEARKAVLASKIAETKSMLDAIRERKAAILSGGQPSNPPVESGQDRTPPPPKTPVSESGGFPKVVRKLENGKALEATVSSAKELEEARKAGFN